MIHGISMKYLTEIGNITCQNSNSVYLLSYVFLDDSTFSMYLKNIPYVPNFSYFLLGWKAI